MTGAQTISVGKSLAISAADSITFTTGDATISMQKDGTISITGKDITIQGTGKITANAAMTMTLKGQAIMLN